MQSQKQQNELGLFPRQAIALVYAPTTEVSEAEVEPFSEDLSRTNTHKRTHTPKCHFHYRRLKYKSQETPGITGKFGLRVQSNAGLRLTEFCQENTLIIENALFQLQEMILHKDIIR